MSTITLHPIQHGFDDKDEGMSTIVLIPDHLHSLFLCEYRFMRRGGASRRHSRWHVWRMIAMIFDGRNNWFATMWDEQDLTDESWADDAEAGWAE